MKQTAHQHDTEYNAYLETLVMPRESLFTTDIDLWPVYLDSFTDLQEKQYHNCHACRQFIRRFGALVTIDPETGRTKSAVWRPENAPNQYFKAVEAMQEAVESARVTGVFLSSDKVLGTPVTGEWTHFAASNARIYRGAPLTAGQAMAEKREDYRNVSRAIGEFSLESLEQVTELLGSDALYRSEKVLGQAKWLFDLKAATSSEKHQLLKKNRVWKAVADAPAGFCHPRASMIGTLLDDLESGMEFDDAARRFKDKMHPLKYRRPTAAPSAGAILAAEKMVKELGVEPSLERRFATLDDMQTIWTPEVEEVEKSGGVFDHLKKGQVKPVCADAGRITWKKFVEEVLPRARKIEVHVPSARSSYIAFLTALDPDCKVIFQWGNHVSWYHWHGGAEASQYGLTPGWVEAKAICLPPYMWEGENLSHFKEDAFFILKGARETRNEGNAIFPETLKSEFHPIRGVVEAHSRLTKIHEVEGEHVIGKGVGSTVRVHTSVLTQYEVDRWD